MLEDRLMLGLRARVGAGGALAALLKNGDHGIDFLGDSGTDESEAVGDF